MRLHDGATAPRSAAAFDPNAGLRSVNLYYSEGIYFVAVVSVHIGRKPWCTYTVPCHGRSASSINCIPVYMWSEDVVLRVVK